MPKATTAQERDIINKAGISLSIFNVCSIVIAMYPRTKIKTTIDNILILV
jgi:hypothetical protein